MGIKCEILPTPPERGAYRSGEKITGVVIYSLDKPMDIPNINLFFKGKLKGKNFCFENWENLKNKEVFISLNKVILEGPVNFMQVGEYTYPFEIELPRELPSTFRNNTCTISYKISVEFMLPELSNKPKKFHKEVLVYGHIDCYSKAPATADLTKNLFPTLKPIDVEIKIKRPYVKAGENIRLDCLIDNDSDLPVNSIITKLIEETTYVYDSEHKKVHRRTIDRTVLESRGAKENSEAKIYSVVPTSPSLFTIRNSKYFTREYKVNVTATFPFPHTKASVDVPVVIEASDDVKMNVNKEANCCLDFLKTIIL